MRHAISYTCANSSNEVIRPTFMLYSTAKLQATNHLQRGALPTNAIP